MTIDEVIEELKNENGYYANNGMTDVAEFNTKIIRMLEELKVIKEKGRYVQGFRAGYKVAVDDFADKLKEMANNSSTKYIRLSEKETFTTYGVDQIAERLTGRVGKWQKLT